MRRNAKHDQANLAIRMRLVDRLWHARDLSESESIERALRIAERIAER